MVICDAAGKSEHEQRIEGHSVAARMSAGRVQGESRDKDMRTLQELRKAKGLTAYQLDEAEGTGFAEILTSVMWYILQSFRHPIGITYTPSSRL